MKNTGIVRKIDSLGRFVLPIEMRNRLDIGPDTGIEIYFDNNSIILKKYEPSCTFCGSTTDVFDFKDKKICKACKAELLLK